MTEKHTPAAILVYSLPDDREDLDLALKAQDYSRALSDIWNKLRSKLKYEDLDCKDIKCYEQVREWFIQACDEFDVEVY